jgi:hypothetical protein
MAVHLMPSLDVDQARADGVGEGLTLGVYCDRLRYGNNTRGRQATVLRDFYGYLVERYTLVPKHATFYKWRSDPISKFRDCLRISILIQEVSPVNTLQHERV